MIERIFGQVLERHNDSLTVLVGGVGLQIFAPRSALDTSEGEQVGLYTHLVVREDALTLYGFNSPEERHVFETLIKVSGVGPRLAVAILSTLTIEHLRNAVGRDEADVITRVPGIGKKTAQKIVIELKGRLGWQVGMGDLPSFSDLDSDVVEALTSLGYSIVEAQSALQSLPPNAPQDVEERIRLALQYFT